MPRAADIELDACPAAKVSYSLSEGMGKPARPPGGSQPDLPKYGACGSHDDVL